MLSYFQICISLLFSKWLLLNSFLCIKVSVSLKIYFTITRFLNLASYIHIQLNTARSKQWHHFLLCLWEISPPLYSFFFFNSSFEPRINFLLCGLSLANLNLLYSSIIYLILALKYIKYLTFSIALLMLLAQSCRFLSTFMISVRVGCAQLV